MISKVGSPDSLQEFRQQIDVIRNAYETDIV